MTSGYLLTVLSTMAAKPGGKIEELFEFKETNKAGIYLVYFYVNGVKKPVIVDDMLPVWSSTMQLVFGSANDDSLWVPILEKAWAKLHSTYFRSVHNTPQFAMSHL